MDRLQKGFDITTIPKIGAVTKVAKDAQKEKEEKDAAAIPASAQQRAFDNIADLADARRRRQAN